MKEKELNIKYIDKVLEQFEEFRQELNIIICTVMQIRKFLEEDVDKKKKIINELYKED